MDSSPHLSRIDSAKTMPGHWLVTGTCAMALLHFARQVLEPIALAAVLSLAIAPLVRQVRLFGLGQTASAFVSVTLLGACAIAVSGVMALQMAAVANDLPRYGERIQNKIAQVRDITARPIAKWQNNLRQIAPPSPFPEAGALQAAASVTPTSGMAPNEVLSYVFTLLSGPIGELAVVFVLLLFMLQEHEVLRDKLIRVVGEADVAKTIKALCDAGEGVSRFIFLQFAVNMAFAFVIGLALCLIGVPHAALWGTFGGLLRFVPYVGVPIAGLATGVFAAAVDPGWSLLLSCLAVFAVVELLLANALEPHIYGHSMGIAPLTVIVSALFWGALWGPVGLLLSTPLTVCLVVASRHVRALSKFAILLGDDPGLTKGLRFYQRALSAEYGDIVNEARRYLRRHSLATYCDHILLPGLAFAASDFNAGRIDREQISRIRATVVRLAESHDANDSGWRIALHMQKVSHVDANVGIHLRRLREQEARNGHAPSASDKVLDSAVLCTGIASERSDLLSELMARSLAYGGVVARSLPDEQLREELSAVAQSAAALVFLAYPLEDELSKWRELCGNIRAALPNVLLVTVRLPPDALDEQLVQADVDIVLHAFSEVVALASDGQRNVGY